MPHSSEAWPRVGAFSWEFKRGELPHLIEGFKQHGLSAVQLSGELLTDALADPASIPALRAALETNGITVAGLGAYRNLVAPDPAKRAASLDYVRRCLELAPLFGSSIVATETGTFHPASDWQPSPANRSEAAWAALSESLTGLLTIAEQHGSILALEGYVNNIIQTPDDLARVLDAFPTPQLQVVLDPFNYLSRDLIAQQTHVVADFLDRFVSRFVLAHLKDVSAAGAETDTPEFGQGVFEALPYLAFLRARRPDLPIILEHLPFDHIPAAIARIDAVLAHSNQ